MTSVPFFELVLALIAASVLLSLAAPRLHLPPAAALVIGGMVLALVPGIPAFDLPPDLILVLFLPPLLQASAYDTAWRDFHASLRPILLLSVGAVVFTTALVGVVAHWMMPSLPWAACFALGAIVSPPDAVAAKAVLQRVMLPRQLMTVLEGESLVNDASGLVLYKFAVAAALTGSFSAANAGVSFVWLIVAGVAFGGLCGYLACEVMRRLHDARSIIVITFLVSWVVYLGAERLEASGVLAVVACGGLVAFRSHQILPAHVRLQANATWQVVVFVLEAFVFVLIGLGLRGVLHRNGGEMTAMGSGLPMACAVTAAVVITRFLWVFPAANASWLLLPRRSRPIRPPAKALVIIGWAGMRGVVTLAAALALPMSFPGRDAILFSAFVVILFTVLVQGTTLGPLIVALKLELQPPAATAMDLLDVNAARLAVNGAALESLEALRAESGDPLHPKLIGEYQRRARAMTRLRDEGELIEIERRDHFAAALGALASGRDELIRLHRVRKIHASVLRTIEAELDLEELRLKRLSGELVE